MRGCRQCTNHHNNGRSTTFSSSWFGVVRKQRVAGSSPDSRSLYFCPSLLTLCIRQVLLGSISVCCLDIEQARITLLFLQPFFAALQSKEIVCTPGVSLCRYNKSLYPKPVFAVPVLLTASLSLSHTETERDVSDVGGCLGYPPPSFAKEESRCLQWFLVRRDKHHCS